jgi:hypothetical protein
MIVLPSPIPHPLELSPFEVPEAVLAEIVGVDWPAGDEAATWDVADRWYALARALARPQEDAVAAASRIDHPQFRDAWERVAGDASAPLNALVGIAESLGTVVDECGRAIEAAKLEAWAEIGRFLIELIGLRVAVALTLGAASPAAEGLVAGSRIAILQNLGRLVSELGAGSARETVTRRLVPSASAGATRRIPRSELLRVARAAAIPPIDHVGNVGQNVPVPAAGVAEQEYLDCLAGIAEECRAKIRDLLPQDPERGGLTDLLSEIDTETSRLDGLVPVTLPEADVRERLPVVSNSLDSVGAVLARYDSHRRAGSRTVYRERQDVRRIEEVTGGSFQNLCPFLGGADPASARSAVDAAMLNLANHLHNSGHGAFAFIITDLEGGGCHAWAAMNENGVILFLDPLMGRRSEDEPLYRHRGTASPGNVISMDALVVDAQERPAPLPFHGPGQWTTAEPTSQAPGQRTTAEPASHAPGQ